MESYLSEYCAQTSFQSLHWQYSNNSTPQVNATFYLLHSPLEKLCSAGGWLKPESANLANSHCVLCLNYLDTQYNFIDLYLFNSLPSVNTSRATWCCQENSIEHNNQLCNVVALHGPCHTTIKYSLFVFKIFIYLVFVVFPSKSQSCIHVTCKPVTARN